MYQLFSRLSIILLFFSFPFSTLSAEWFPSVVDENSYVEEYDYVDPSQMPCVLGFMAALSKEKPGEYEIKCRLGHSHGTATVHHDGMISTHFMLYLRPKHVKPMNWVDSLAKSPGTNENAKTDVVDPKDNDSQDAPKTAEPPTNLSEGTVPANGKNPKCFLF